MPGKVFITCGQRPPTERKIAVAIKDLLEQEFSLTPYLAFRIQSLDDIMTIAKELRSSDYYLFIDFCRDPKKAEDLPISLFTHQELALAHHLGFQNIIALQQEGAPLEGFLRYLLSNPETFSSEEELLEKTRRLVKERGWSRSYSRNLVVEPIGFTGPLQYRDHTGMYLENVWQVRVRNHRPDVAAVGSVCLLGYMQMADGPKNSSPDRSHLKWAGQAGYERTILPTDYGDIDVFSIHSEAPGIFLHSLRDTPREPVLKNDSDYKLFFKLYSQGFPMVEFSVKLSLRWTPPTQVQFQWQNNTTAELEF